MYTYNDLRLVKSLNAVGEMLTIWLCIRFLKVKKESDKNFFSRMKELINKFILNKVILKKNY